MKPDDTGGPGGEAAARIPICLLTGFLGSGKTTLLKRIARSERGRRLVYLVNEFSPRDIDGALVSAEHPDVVCIPGGSIFCACLVTEFMARLGEIPGRFGAVEGVVIEASGMANPRGMASLLAQTRLDRRYTLARVVSLVDPGSFFKLRRTLPAILAQVQAADLALITKADLFDADTVARLAGELRGLNPGLDIRPCIRGEAEFDLFGPGVGAPPRPLFNDAPAPCRDPLYETVDIALTRPLDPVELRDRLLAVEDELYRLKGHVRTPEGGRVRVDYAKAGFASEPGAPDAPPSLVLIHRANPSPALNALLAWLRG